MMFVATPEGIELAHRERKFAVLMGIEGGHSIEDSSRFFASITHLAFAT